MPNNCLTYRRGEIWWTALDPAIGVEAQKTRACLVLQNDEGNKYSSLTTVVPFLAKKDFPFMVNIPASKLNNLDRDRGLHFNQIKAVDSSRLKQKLGKIEDKYWSEIEQAVQIQLGFDI